MQPARATACKSHEMLKDRVRADMRVYREAIETLDEIARREGAGSGFEKAVRNAEIAQRSFKAARDRLNRHISSHRCI